MNSNSFSLYKYTKIEYINSCLRNGVFASYINENLNDPYEIKDIRYRKLFRVCCMTKSEKQMLMWAYYGNHRECSIEYIFDEDVQSLIKPVEYVTEFTDHSMQNNDEIARSLLKKSKEWAHESEYRAVYYEKDIENSHKWKVINDKVFLRAKVKTITFGLRAENNPEYKDSLLCIYNYNIKCNPDDVVIVRKCKLSDKRYAIEMDKQYDYTLEL